MQAYPTPGIRGPAVSVAGAIAAWNATDGGELKNTSLSWDDTNKILGLGGLTDSFGGIQRNGAGVDAVLAGGGGLAALGAKSLSLTGGTITAAAPLIDMTRTWNNSGVTFTSLKLNITDTASAAGSLLVDLQVGGSSKFKVDKTGVLTIATPVAATSGGTGLASYAVGDLLYADTTTTLAKLADVAAGSVLVSGGTNAAPNWSTSVSVGTVISPIIRAVSSANGTASNFAINSGATPSAQANNSGLQLAGSTNMQYRSLFNGATTGVLVANAAYAGMIIGDQPVTEGTSGTHPIIAGFAINGPTITNGSATTTDLTTVYIAGPPTGITPTNPATALWVASGTSKFGGPIQTNATCLPTADPHVAGQLWNNSGVVTVSAG